MPVVVAELYVPELNNPITVDPPALIDAQKYDTEDITVDIYFGLVYILLDIAAQH
jgi:hypothetical protein